MKPILFNGETMKYILNGKKTQTRRVVKFPKHIVHRHGSNVAAHQAIASINLDGGGNWVGWSHKSTDKFTTMCYPTAVGFLCPYGRPGDMLWVKEIGTPWDCSEMVGTWRPSIHMPRWASRIILTVKNVRVERLQDITDEDAKMEGVVPIPFASGFDDNELHKAAFFHLWDSINAKRGYPVKSNPFVWVVEFCVG